MPMASAPYALPCAISARIRLVPSCAGASLSTPRASRIVTTSGFSFSSVDFAKAASRILRAVSSESSAMAGVLCSGRSGFDLGAVEAHRQHARDVKRLALRAIVDLVPAGGAVGDDERRLVGTAYGGQQRQLGHLDRGVIGLGAIAEGAGHAAA